MNSMYLSSDQHVGSFSKRVFGSTKFYSDWLPFQISENNYFSPPPPKTDLNFLWTHVFVVIILIYFQLCPLRITSKYFARVAYWEGDLFSQSDQESHSSHLLCCILLLAPTYILIHNCWRENYIVIIVIKQMGPFLCQICLFFLLFSNRSKPILINGALSQHAWVLAISSVFKMSSASIMANT